MVLSVTDKQELSKWHDIAVRSKANCERTLGNINFSVSEIHRLDEEESDIISTDLTNFPVVTYFDLPRHRAHCRRLASLRAQITTYKQNARDVQKDLSRHLEYNDKATARVQGIATNHLVHTFSQAKGLCAHTQSILCSFLSSYRFSDYPLIPLVHEQQNISSN